MYVAKGPRPLARRREGVTAEALPPSPPPPLTPPLSGRVGRGGAASSKYVAAGAAAIDIRPRPAPSAAAAAAAAATVEATAVGVALPPAVRGHGAPRQQQAPPPGAAAPTTLSAPATSPMTRRTARSVDVEDEEDEHEAYLVMPRTRKRGRKAR